MGCIKFRQGRSINVGLPINHPNPVVSYSRRYSGHDDLEESRVGWLMAVVHAITKPFVKMAQNYRGRGNR